MTGIQSGMVMQRKNDLCDIIINTEKELTLLSALGSLNKISENSYRLSGIPTGGPYKLSFSDGEREYEYTDIYVGDVWVLAGQSNMEGAGQMRKEQYDYEASPIKEVRAFYCGDFWDVARPQLHQGWLSKDEFISDITITSRLNSKWGNAYPENELRGVGPGLYFALGMYEKTGVPQGVIPCALGGSNLSQWNPENGPLYSAMKRRFAECGSSVKGVFWHQGESECYFPNGCCNYVDNMKKLVSSMRRDFNNPEMPFVYAQISNFFIAGRQDDPAWMRIRELQRALIKEIDNTEVVYTVDCRHDDLIHLSSEAHIILGKRASDAMWYLLTGEGLPSIELEGFEMIQNETVPFWTDLKIVFKNVGEKLISTGVPSGISIMRSVDGEEACLFSRIDLGENFIMATTELSPEELSELYVCYAHGNHYFCNITDNTDRSIPGFGPLKISENII